MPGLSAFYSLRAHVCLLYALVFLCAYGAAGGDHSSSLALLWAAGVYLAIQLSYVFNRAKDRDEDAFNGDAFPEIPLLRRPLAALLPVGLLIMAALYFHPPSWPAALYGFVVVPLYSWDGFPLKRFLLFKPLSVAAGFFMISVYLPVSLLSGGPVHPGGLLGLAGAVWPVLTLFFLNSVFLDLRDEPGDSRAGVVTIPAVAGHRNAAVLLSALSAALAFFLFLRGDRMAGGIAVFLAAASAGALREPGRDFYNHVILAEDAACLALLLL